MASAIARHGSYYVIGGWNGVVLGDIKAFSPSVKWCGMQTDVALCLSSFSCGFCNPSTPVTNFVTTTTTTSFFSSDTTVYSICVAQALSCPASDYTWQKGSCLGYCSSFKSCVDCTAQPECGWCLSSQLCLSFDNLAVNCTVDLNGTFTEKISQCVFKSQKTGVTLENYYGNFIRSIAGFESYALYQDFMPSNSDVLTVSLHSQTTASTVDGYYGERLHALLHVPISGTYYFWIKSRQGIASNLYINPNGSSWAGAILIAKDGLDVLRPNLAWNQNPTQQSEGIVLVQNFQYYIKVLTYVYPTQIFGLHDVQVAWIFNCSVCVPTDNNTISTQYLEQVTVTNCSEIDNCFGCVAAQNCGFCDGVCIPYNLTAFSYCDSTILDSSHCADCGAFTECQECVQQIHCDWSLGYVCLRHNNVFNGITGDVSLCPVRCESYSLCSDCITNDCGWCTSTHSCFDQTNYLQRFEMGGCLAWTWDISVCPACNSYTTCGTCLAAYRCGWCFLPDDPTKGLCNTGSFGGSSMGSICITNIQNTSLVYTGWAYATCPNVDMCRLHYDNCTETTTCVNVPISSFECVCKSGFTPFNATSCIPICNGCMHGTCSAPYTCSCDTYWSGENCTDCYSANMTDGCDSLSLCDNNSKTCECIEGYKLTTLNVTFSPTQCVPICSSCYEGICVAPETCQCNLGFEGIQCDQCNQSFAQSKYHCDANARCTYNTTISDFGCVCGAGYKGSGLSCSPICTECYEGFCIAPETCQCKFTFTGTTCDQCNQTYAQDYYQCTANSLCAYDKNISHVVCVCEAGYTRSGLLCSPICTDCYEGICVAPETCHCNLDFAGTTCDQCNQSFAQSKYHCDANARCTYNTTISDFGCVCGAGYKGSGLSCSPICTNCYEGICVAPEACQCDYGASGTSCNQCDTTVSMCSSDGICGKSNMTTILNFIELVDAIINSTYNVTKTPVPVFEVKNGSYFCACKPGFIGNGLQCVPYCSAGCIHGVCEYAFNGDISSMWGHCNCSLYWTGTDCNECIPSNAHCAMHASCISDYFVISTSAPLTTGTPISITEVSTVFVEKNGTTSFHCICNAGYIGDGDFCLPQCLTYGCVHGNCTAPDICVCDIAWSGNNCTACAVNTNPWYIN